MLKRLKLLFITLMQLSVLVSVAQYAGQGKLFDSLIKNINQYPNADTLRLNALIKVLEQAVANATPSKAEVYWAEALILAKKFKDPLSIANCYHFAGFLSTAKKNYDKALLYLDSAIFVFRGMTDTVKRLSGIGNADLDKARVYRRMGDRYSQLQNLLESLQLFEKIDDKKAVFAAQFISLLYRDLSNTSKDLEYAEKAAMIAERKKDDELKIEAWLNYTEGLLSAKDAAKAMEWLQRSKPLIFSTGNIYHKWSYYSFLGRSYQLQKNYAEAQQNFLKALSYAKKAGHGSFIRDVLAYLTYSYLQTKDWKESKPYLEQYLQLSRQDDVPNTDERDALRRLAEYYNRSGNYKVSSQYAQQALQVNDSLLLEENAEQLNQLEAKYQFDKKENEIKQLQKEGQIRSLQLKQKNTFNYILLAAVTLMLLLAFLIFRNYRHRQQLQVQKMRELEKDKQLAVTDSMLKGEEKERERLAKDLHDGLGGLLSGVKLSLSNVKATVIKNGENAERLERSLDLLDTSISELRRVAHNMMPEVLMKSGLNVALTDYCKSINASSDVQIAYQGYGMNRKLDNSVALIIYRIIQELINNALKHAEATQILLQVVQREKNVSVTVEDNGKGFEVQQLAETEGAGWKNIRSRIEYLRGITDVKSELGKGTSVNIELQV